MDAATLGRFSKLGYTFSAQLRLRTGKPPKAQRGPSRCPAGGRELSGRGAVCLLAPTTSETQQVLQAVQLHASLPHALPCSPTLLGLFLRLTKRQSAPCAQKRCASPPSSHQHHSTGLYHDKERASVPEAHSQVWLRQWPCHSQGHTLAQQRPGGPPAERQHATAGRPEGAVGGL